MEKIKFFTDNGEGLDFNVIFSAQRDVASQLMWICNYFHCDFWEFIHIAFDASVNKATDYIDNHPDDGGDTVLLARDVLNDPTYER